MKVPSRSYAASPGFFPVSLSGGNLFLVRRPGRIPKGSFLKAKNLNRVKESAPYVTKTKSETLFGLLPLIVAGVTPCRVPGSLQMPFVRLWRIQRGSRRPLELDIR